MSGVSFRERERPAGPGGARPNQQSTTDDEALSDETGWYVCGVCDEKVIREDWLLDSGERRPLVFSNPHGLVFELVLAARAVGLVLTGYATSQHTWFEGYAWRVAFCCRCETHLGWQYEAALPGRSPAYFVGLSQNALKFMNGS